MSWQNIITDILEAVNEEDISVTICLQLVRIPEESERQNIIMENHASALAGHKGVTKTYNRIRPLLFLERNEESRGRLYSKMRGLSAEETRPC